MLSLDASSNPATNAFTAVGKTAAGVDVCIHLPRGVTGTHVNFLIFYKEESFNYGIHL